jgi:hypothetical protein
MQRVLLFAVPALLFGATRGGKEPADPVKVSVQVVEMAQ